MERAFVVHGLDWRAITVEISEADLSVAIDGLQAMHFMALRIFPTLQRVAAEKLCGPDPICHFVGAVTSAKLGAAGWEAWSHHGFAILDLIGARADWERTQCWLHGDSHRTRALLAALAAGVVEPAGVWWTDAPAEIPADLQALLSPGPPGAAVQPDSSPGEAGHPISDKVSEAETLVVVGDDLPALLEQPLLAEWNGSLLLVGETTDGLPHGAHRLSEVELAVAAEAHDFARWTGLEADLALLRDAYDEYCDF